MWCKNQYQQAEQMNPAKVVEKLRPYMRWHKQRYCCGDEQQQQAGAPKCFVQARTFGAEQQKGGNQIRWQNSR